MFKNTASQKLTVFAFADAGHATLDPGEPVTGDAANITCKVEQDDDGTRTAVADTNPTETEDGQYRFDLTQAETNGDKLTFYPESSTAGVQVVALPSSVIYTRPTGFTDLTAATVRTQVDNALSDFDADEVDTYVFGDQSIFRTLFNSAFTSCQRIAVIGDSRETSPGGTGRVFIHRLNSQSYHTIAPPSESYIAFPISNSNNFILRTTNSNFSTTTSYSPTELPETRIGEQSGTSYGFISLLNYDADGTNMTQPTWADVGEEWFPRRNLTNLQAEIYVWAHGSSPDQFRVINRPNNDDQADYFAAANGIEVFNESLSTQSGWLTFTSASLTLDASNPYQQVEIHGWNGASRATGFVCGGMRWIDSDRDEGMTFQSFASGGATADSWLTSYTNSYDQFNAYGPWDAIILSFGINDAAAGISEADFKVDMQALIDRLRDATWGQTDVPIILLSDLDRVASGGFSGVNVGYLQGYPAKLQELCDENENVAFIDLHGFANDNGYAAATDTSDDVHFTDDFSAKLADWLWHNMCRFGFKQGFSDATLAKQNLIATRTANLETGVNVTTIAGTTPSTYIRTQVDDALNTTTPPYQNPPGTVKDGQFYHTMDPSKLLDGNGDPVVPGDTPETGGVIATWENYNGTRTMTAVGSPRLWKPAGKRYPMIYFDGASYFRDTAANNLEGAASGSFFCGFQRAAGNIASSACLYNASDLNTTGFCHWFGNIQTSADRNNVICIQGINGASSRTYNTNPDEAGGRATSFSAISWASDGVNYTMRNKGPIDITGTDDGAWFGSNGSFDYEVISIGARETSSVDRYLTGSIAYVGLFEEYDTTTVEDLHDYFDSQYESINVLLLGDSRLNTNDLFAALEADNPRMANYREEATGGNTIISTEAQWDAMKANGYWDYVVVLCGINATISGTTAVTALGQMEALLDNIEAVSNVGTIILCNETPAKNNGSFTATEHYEHVLFSRWLEAEAGRRPRVTLADTWSALDDPDDPGAILAAYTSDDLHPNAAGDAVITSLFESLILYSSELSIVEKIDAILTDTGSTLADQISSLLSVPTIGTYPVQPTAEEINIIRGDAYDDVANDKLSWTLSKDPGTIEQINFAVRDCRTDELLLTQDDVTLNLSGTTLTLAIASGVTDALAFGHYRFDIEIQISATSKWTVARGVINIEREESRA